MPLGLPAVWVALGQPTRAEQIARTINGPFEQAEALTAVARAVAAAGDLDRAEEIARTITGPFQQAEALTAVARAVAAAGNLDRAKHVATMAEQIARTITGPSQQTLALTAIAQVAGLQWACRLLGEAFAVGSWMVALPVLARLRPQAVLQIAEEIYGDDRSRDTQTSPGGDPDRRSSLRR